MVKNISSIPVDSEDLKQSVSIVDKNAVQLDHDALILLEDANLNTHTEENKDLKVIRSTFTSICIQAICAFPSEYKTDNKFVSLSLASQIKIIHKAYNKLLEYLPDENPEIVTVIALSICYNKSMHNIQDVLRKYKIKTGKTAISKCYSSIREMINSQKQKKKKKKDKTLSDKIAKIQNILDQQIHDINTSNKIAQMIANTSKLPVLVQNINKKFNIEMATITMNLLGLV